MLPATYKIYLLCWYSLLRYFNFRVQKLVKNRKYWGRGTRFLQYFTPLPVYISTISDEIITFDPTLWSNLPKHRAARLLISWRLFHPARLLTFNNFIPAYIQIKMHSSNSFSPLQFFDCEHIYVQGLYCYLHI